MMFDNFTNKTASLFIDSFRIIRKYIIFTTQQIPNMIYYIVKLN